VAVCVDPQDCKSYPTTLTNTPPDLSPTLQCSLALQTFPVHYDKSHLLPSEHLARPQATWVSRRRSFQRAMARVPSRATASLWSMYSSKLAEESWARRQMWLTLMIDRYTGWLRTAGQPEEKGKQFDSTTGRGSFQTPIGVGRVIKGTYHPVHLVH
jgi:hypothetical protein